MVGDKTSFKEEEQTTHSTAEWEKLSREQGETCQTDWGSMHSH